MIGGVGGGDFRSVALFVAVRRGLGLDGLLLLLSRLLLVLTALVAALLALPLLVLLLLFGVLLLLTLLLRSLLLSFFVVRLCGVGAFGGLLLLDGFLLLEGREERLDAQLGGAALRLRRLAVRDVQDGLLNTKDGLVGRAKSEDRTLCGSGALLLASPPSTVLGTPPPFPPQGSLARTVSVTSMGDLRVPTK